MLVEAYNFTQYCEDDNNITGRFQGTSKEIREFKLAQMLLAEDLGVTYDNKDISSENIIEFSSTETENKTKSLEKDLEKAQESVAEWISEGGVKASKSVTTKPSNFDSQANIADQEITKIIETAKNEAEEIMKNAAYSASQVIEAANEKAKEIADEAMAKGFEEGFNEGQNKGIEQGIEEFNNNLKNSYEKLINDLYLTAIQIDHEKEELIKNHLESLRDLAISVAEKVVHTSLKSSGAIIERMLLAAVETTGTHQWAKIRISIEDAEKLYEARIDIAKSLRNVADRVKVEVMDNAQSGTLYIEFPDQIIDASVQTQIQNIRTLADKF